MLRFLAEVRRRRRSALGIPEGLALVRTWGEASSPRPLPELIAPGSRVLLVGPPGSGKSDAGLAALEGLGDGVLPVYARARAGARRVEELISSAFDAVRFTPGRDLIVQYLRDGVLAVMVDGIDELPSDDRAALLESIEEVAVAYRRTPLLIAGRVLSPDVLNDFERSALVPLDPSQIDVLFNAFGYGSTHIAWNVGAPLADLVGLPFWAALTAQFGRSATSGLQLLDQLVDRRLAVGLVGDGVRQDRAREVIGSLASRIHPAVETTIARALHELQDWSVGAIYARQ